MLIQEKISGRYGHINGTIGEVEDKKYLNYRWNWGEDRPSCFYNELTASTQMDDKTLYAYAFDLTYQDKYSIDLRAAENMVSTLRRLEKRLDKMNEADGYCKTVSGYMLRVAKTMGIKQFAFIVKQPGMRFNTFEFMNKEDAKQKMDKMETSVINKLHE